ncbi:MAG: hypothetical protein QOH61_318 [Chloroflexota bacterium]|nr:hypothetical protein [Chloroflexota bacterium]
MPARTAYGRLVTRESVIPRLAMPWAHPAPIARAMGPLSRLRAVGRERVAVAAILLLAALARIPALGSTLDEFAHPFRQTQTAYVALLFHEHGIDLLHARLPVLGPPFEVPLELPLFQALASVVMNAGVAPDLALRLTAMAFFFLTAGLLWAFVRRISSGTAAMAALILFVASPFALVWSRAQLIEYMATAAALAWLLFAMRWRDSGGRWAWLLAVGSGCVALLVKVTTGAFWILPLLAYRAAPRADGPKGASRLRRRLPFLALLGIPFLTAGAWTLYADQVKSQSPLTAWLMSSQLTTWNFGTLSQRLDPNTWITLIVRATQEFGGLLAALFLVGLVICFRVREQRRLWLAVAATAVLPPLVFTNLYLIHDYYLVAVSGGIAMVQGLLVAYLLAPLRRPRVRRLAIAAAAVLLVASIAASSYFWGYAYERQTDPSGSLAQAAELAANSAATDLVVTEGRDWSPEILYLARREGLAVPTWLAEGGRTDLIDPQIYRSASFMNPSTGHLELLARWPIVEVLGERTYGLRMAARDLGQPRLLAADDGTLPVPAATTALTAAPIEVPCDGQTHAIPAGTAGTWLELSPAPATARLIVGDAYGAVPARRLVLIGRGLTPAGHVQLACLGATSIVVERALDGPMPGR